jgi:hypothetical protein
MPSENLAGMFGNFVVQNAPKFTDAFVKYVEQNKEQIGRLLAQLMLESLSGKGSPFGAGPLPFAGSAELPSLPSSSTSPSPNTPAVMSGKSSRGRRRFPKFPGSAKDANKKIVAAIAEKGSSIHELVEKTGYPIDYVRTRLNRMIRSDAPQVVCKGKTSKARYFRT